MENEEIIDVIKTESFGNLVKHPDGGFFYFADSDKNVKLYSYDGGKIFIGDTFLDGEIFKAHNLKISSNYLFTTSGVYKISQNPQNLKLHFSFGFPCNVLIDGQNSRFFGVDDSFITEYDINSFEIVRGISVGYLYNTESYFINGKIVLMEFYNDEITIRIINPDLSPEINYEKEKVSLWNYPDRISWDGEMYFSDNFYLKEEDVIYILSNDLCKIDLKQNEMIKVKVPYSCHKLYFENNKLYLPCSGNDIILVFDKDLTRIDTLFPGIDFFDISFGNDGYLYLAYEYGIFSYDLGKNEVYKKMGLGFEFTEIIKDPKSNVFYLHDDYYSAPLTKITYDNGEIIDIHSFGNMYHGIHYFLDGRIIDYYGNLYELGNNTLSFLSGPPFYSRTSYIENNSLYTLYDEFIYEYDLDTFKLKSIMEISYGYYNEGEVDLYKKMAMLCYYALTG